MTLSRPWLSPSPRQRQSLLSPGVIRRGSDAAPDELPLAVIPFGPPLVGGDDSDIVDLNFDVSQTLRLRIDHAYSASKFTDIVFTEVWAFSCLPNCEFAATYWGHSEFERDRLIYQVAEGGWLARMSESELPVGSTMELKEWLVAALNNCVTVLSVEEPTVSTKDAE